MNDFTIDGFWKKRLPERTQATAALVELPVNGWTMHPEVSSTFVEAPLSLYPPLEDGDRPENCPIILVAAPGAVGKSTLARQIASQTGAVFVDLAKAGNVGDNTFTGSVVKAKINAEWEREEIAVLIDGLDEARIKVSKDSFKHFIADVVSMAKGRQVPTILFGRTRAVEEAWSEIFEQCPVSVLEIGHFGRNKALDFAYSYYEYGCELDGKKTYPAVAREILGKLIDALPRDASNDGDRFAGYAPVLQTVAKSVVREENLGALKSQIEGGNQAITLHTIIDDIVSRERKKLDPLNFETPLLKDKLYSKSEQLSHLVSYISQQVVANVDIEMSPQDKDQYLNALSTWMPDHPFLDGTGKKAANPVFEAVVSLHALKSNGPTQDKELLAQLARGQNVNPFLFEFYVADNTDKYIRPEHIGVVYASLRSRLSFGDMATLSVEAIEDEVEGMKTTVEICHFINGGKEILYEFNSDQAGILHMGSYLEDVEIVAPNAVVNIGGHEDTTLMAPISIQCREINFSTSNIAVDAQREISLVSTNIPQPNKPNSVLMEAEEFVSPLVSKLPAVRGGSQISVISKNDLAFPWVNYRSEQIGAKNPEIREALLKFRRIIIAFRSHSRGGLKRFKDKIDHERMTKGSGKAIRNYLLAKEILTLDGVMYTLHPEKLASIAGTSYFECAKGIFTEKAEAFVTEAIKDE